MPVQSPENGGSGTDARLVLIENGCRRDTIGGEPHGELGQPG